MSLNSILYRFAHVGFENADTRRHQAPAAAALPESCTLPRHATLTLANMRLQLQVLRGCVWITQDGNPADIVLEAGDIFAQHPGARVLVHALATAEMRIAGVGAAT